MSDDLFVQHCSPTLAGMKAGSLFSCSFQTRKELEDYIIHANRILSPKGIRVMVLRSRDNRALVYMFRPHAVEKILADPMAAALLRQRGYEQLQLESCLRRLMSRIRQQEEFPHEIGLFLGYPPEDVRGFIENAARNQKCVGCWKVYGDEEAARKTFAKYKKCTAVYCSQWQKGKSIEKLAVAG